MSLNGTEDKKVLMKNIQHFLDIHTRDVLVVAASPGFRFVRKDTKVPLVGVETWDDVNILLNGIKIGAYHGRL